MNRKLRFEFHQVRREVTDLRVAHEEYITENEVEHTTVFFLRAHIAFGNDDVLLFDEARDLNSRAPDERLVFDLLVERGLSSDMKCARYQPFDVGCKAGQDRGVISPGEAVHVLLNRDFIRGHEIPFGRAARITTPAEP